MLVQASHAVALLTLSAAAALDLKTTEVPDWLSVFGILSGITLHAAASFTGSANLSVLTRFPLILSEPFTWFQALGDPLIWCLGVGIVFSIYGWALYFLGLWGGADAFAMGVLGFGAPYAVGAPGVMFGLDLFVNILLAGFVYTLLFAFYRAYSEEDILEETYSRIKDNEVRVVGEIFVAAVLSAVGSATGRFDGLAYFALLLSMIFLYRFLKVVQDNSLEQEKQVEDVEPGEVVESDQLHDKIKGVTEEDLESLEGKVVVKEGVRFVPVFPVALALTEFTGVGIRWFVHLIS